MNEREPRTVRFALASVAAAASAISVYALLRLWQKARATEPDPALVLWSAHAGFFWRIWIGLYVGGTAGFLAYVAAGRQPVETARVLSAAVVIATLLLLVQALFVP